MKVNFIITIHYVQVPDEEKKEDKNKKTKA